MHNQLPKDLLLTLDKLAETGKAINDPPYILGGFVRDWLWGFPIEDVTDIDVITQYGKSDEFLDDISARFGLGMPIQYDFTETKKILIDGYKFELQSPTNLNVHYPIEDDLRKMEIPVTFFNKNIYERDFTINCICYDIINKQIIDLTGGIDDLLVNRLIKTPIATKHAMEYNPLIILRAIRFALQFKLTPEKEFRQLLPYGISLLPKLLEKRSKRFVEHVITEIFSYGEDDADKIFRFYGLYDLLPIPKELKRNKVKKDMGIIYQANSQQQLMSFEVDNFNKIVKIGCTTFDLQKEENKNTLELALSDLYINNKIDQNYKIHFINEESPTFKLSEVEKIFDKTLKPNWYKFAISSLPDKAKIYDRYQRRSEYKHRKRREEKRNRIDKIKTWREISGLARSK